MVNLCISWVTIIFCCKELVYLFGFHAEFYICFLLPLVWKTEVSQLCSFSTYIWLCCWPCKILNGDKICTVLGYCTASNDNFLPVFWDGLLVQSSIGHFETSARNYHYSLRYNLEEHISHLLVVEVWNHTF